MSKTKSVIILEFNKPDINGDVFVSGCIKTPKDSILVIDKDCVSPIGNMENIRESDGQLIGEITILPDRIKDFEENTSFAMGGECLKTSHDKKRNIRLVEEFKLWVLAIVKRRDES